MTQGIVETKTVGLERLDLSFAGSAWLNLSQGHFTISHTPEDTLITIEIVDRRRRVTKTGRSARTTSVVTVIPGGWGASGIVTSPTS